MVIGMDLFRIQGSDMEGDDDDYQDMDNSVVPNQDDDFLFHLEDMQVGSRWSFALGITISHHVTGLA